MDVKKYSFIARETVMMALEPYSTLRGVSEPDRETKEALEEFREIIKKDRKDGLLIILRLVQRQNMLRIEILLKKCQKRNRSLYLAPGRFRCMPFAS